MHCWNGGPWEALGRRWARKTRRGGGNGRVAARVAGYAGAGTRSESVEGEAGRDGATAAPNPLP